MRKYLRNIFLKYLCEMRVQQALVMFIDSLTISSGHWYIFIFWMLQISLLICLSAWQQFRAKQCVFIYSTILLFNCFTWLTTVRRLSFVNYFLAICSFSFAFPLFPALISRKELNNSLNNPSRGFSCIFLTSCKTFSF